MPSLSSALDATTLQRVASALASVPRAAYSVPHVYPSAAPAYTEAPMAERPPLDAEQLRLYVHVPFCRYHCTFCYFAVRVGASTETMARYVRALERELELAPSGTPLSQLFVGGGTPTALPPELLDELLETIFRAIRPCRGTCTPSRPRPRRSRRPTSRCSGATASGGSAWGSRASTARSSAPCTASRRARERSRPASSWSTPA